MKMGLKKMLVILIFTFVSLQSQEIKRPLLEITPKIGMMFSTQDVDIIKGERTKVGFTTGIGFTIYPCSSNFAIQPEINFVEKGSKINNNSGNNTYSLNYLELPILARYNINNVYVSIGPSVGFLIKSNDQAKTFYKPKTIDVGLIIGAGLTVPAGFGKFVVDVRYNSSLSNISNNVDVLNKGIAISLGYAIPLYSNNHK